MLAKKYLLSSVDASRDTSTPLIGMKPLYYGAVSTSNLFSACARSIAKDLNKLLVSHFSAAARVASAFLSVVISCVFTPVWLSPRVFVPCVFPQFLLLFFALLCRARIPLRSASLH